ncbi:MAG: pyridoxamine 5'-phosphate oxidase family protein [Betaproteobacteria bacterium]|nr:pyridoxamine 5'-phosphate oxidase family protein [Betaproteobacteria bacterium]
MALKTPRTTVRRLPKRAAYDFETLAGILDASFLCHVGYVLDGQPYVIPTAFGREERTLYLHGSAVSRTLKTLAGGVPLCLTVTHLDGLVLARSGFHSSMNYRSAVVLGTAVPVEGPEKVHALAVISDQIMRGRWEEIRGPSRKELNGTAVLKMPIDEASAKIRTGPPVDDEDDYALPVWAGVLPLSLVAGKPIPDERLPAEVPLPAYVKKYRKG